MKKYTLIISLFVLLIVAGAVYATGSLTPPAGNPTVTGYTLTDVYNKLVSGTPASGHVLSTSNPVSVTFRTISEIYNAIPGIQTISPSSTAVPVGINRTATTLSNIDTDLIASNIKSGVNLFGVTGTYTGSGGGGTVPLSWSTAFYNPSAPSGYRNGLCWTSDPAIGCTVASTGGLFNNQGIAIGAREYCTYMNQAGTALTTTANNYWRLPIRGELYDELTRLIVFERDIAALEARFPASGGGTFRYWTSEVAPPLVVGPVSYPHAWVVGSVRRTTVDVVEPFYQSNPTNASVICVKP